MSVRPKGALGVKIADGAIVAVHDFSSQRWNQTVFTTVGDKQNKALFDFYFRAEGTGGWRYLDSLPLSHIPPAPAGGPELRVRTQVDARGNLSLQIHDPAVSTPFSFVLKAETLGRIRQATEANNRRRWVLVLAPVAVLLVAVILLWRSGRPLAETTSWIEMPTAEMEARVADTSAAQGIGPPQEDRNVKAGDDREYSITWGDTLWRITERFYGNPDLYPAVANANRLPDPDVIVAGKTLLLPPLLREERASSSNESRTSR
jgi:hypothetical protein